MLGDIYDSVWFCPLLRILLYVVTCYRMIIKYLQCFAVSIPHKTRGGRGGTIGVW